MGDFGYAKSFKDLAVYQKARVVSAGVFQLSKSFPRDEQHSLTDQIRRSSRSIGTQIAEAWGKRRYEKHFVSKLTDADAGQYETQHWLDEAQNSGYVTPEQADQILKELFSVGRMPDAMIIKADLFCGLNADRVREDLAEYIVDE